MANPNRGQVALTVGDLEYKLSFSVNAICELETELDKSVSEIIASIQDPKQLRLSSVRALVWAALRDHHEEITIKEAGLIATAAGIQVVVEKIGHAFKLAFPDAPEAKGKANPPKAAVAS
ncbi:GTA-gp10 family protein [Mesorhizobium sp. A623]